MFIFHAALISLYVFFKILEPSVCGQSLNTIIHFHLHNSEHTIRGELARFHTNSCDVSTYPGEVWAIKIIQNTKSQITLETKLFDTSWRISIPTQAIYNLYLSNESRGSIWCIKNLTWKLVKLPWNGLSGLNCHNSTVFWRKKFPWSLHISLPLILSVPVTMFLD